MRSSTTVLSLFIFGLFIALSQCAFAQPCPPGCPSLLPIDGGISFLLVAGAAYGVKKIHESRNRKSS